MSDRRVHRGARPEDARDFQQRLWPTLRASVSDLSWLLTRGYSEVASLKLVGDRHQLTQRQRMAVLRAACTDEASSERARKRLSLDELAGKRIGIDGFNCLITVEAMLSGAPVFVGRDGAHRDLASVHGTYRKVNETLPALQALRVTLEAHRLSEVAFYLDRPVGNSGRLRGFIEQLFATSPCQTSVELCDNVDPVIARREAVVASSDSWVLDRAQHWVDLPDAVARKLDLSLERIPLGAD